MTENNLLPIDELALTRKAARGRWNVPQAVKIDSIKKIHDLINSGDPQISIEAVKTAVAMDKVDLQEDAIRTPRHLVVTNTPTKELLEQLEQMGGAKLIQALRSKLLPSEQELSTVIDVDCQ